MIAALLAGLTALLAPAGWFERLDGIVTDLAYPRGDADPSVVVVGIDQRSLAEVEPTWPWTRSRLAELVDDLADAGAKTVVIDLVLAAPAEGDSELAAAMGRVPTVLTSAATTASAPSGRPMVVGAGLQPTPQLAAAAVDVGHAQVVADGADGVVRTFPAVVEDPDRRIVPALSLAALGASEGVTNPPILRRPSGVQVGDTEIPTDDRYRVRISWPEGLPPDGSPGPVVSAVDVLDGTVDPGVLRDRVVFIGVTDPTLGDQIATPISKQINDPGVMVQAAAFHTLASRQFIDEPSMSATVAVVFVLALLVALAVQFLPLALGAAATVVLLAASAAIPVLRAAEGRPLYSLYPMLAAALAVPLSLAVRYFTETRARRRVNQLFARYVPPPVAAELTRDGKAVEAAEGTRVTLTVFFCDLRGFTPMAASLEPAQVNQVLSRYYEYVSSAILAEDGTIIQYVGDEVFAVFGAPLARDDHAEVALRVAFAVQAGRGVLEAELAELGLPMVEFGIGVNSGEVVAVHAGSTFRRQYAVVGDPVNVGARLCSQALAGQVVAADSTVSASPDPDRSSGVREVPELKGVAREVVVWRFTPQLDRAGQG